MYTHFSFLFLYFCLIPMNENNIKLLLWQQNSNTSHYLAMKYCD